MKSPGREDLDHFFDDAYVALQEAAAVLMRSERQDHTLQPSALVHEAYVRLSEQTRIQWQSVEQFRAIAAQMMRRVLVDHARARNSQKRQAPGDRTTLDSRVVGERWTQLDVLELNDLLSRLGADDARTALVVELRVFGGLTLEETAAALNVSSSTVEREWRYARAWLISRLTESSNSEH